MMREFTFETAKCRRADSITSGNGLTRATVIEGLMGLLVCVTIVSAIGGCGDGGVMNEEALLRGIESGLEKIEEAKQFDEVFGASNVDHFVSYSGPGLGSTWSSRVFFGGRYQLTMQCEVKMSRNYDEVLNVLSPAQFYFIEYGRIIQGSEGRTIVHEEIPNPFGAELWQRLYLARGDVSVLSESLVADQPELEGFEEFARAWRRDMLKRPAAK